MLIDTHFHLDLMANMQSLIRDLQYSDVGVMAVGTTPKAYEKEKLLCRDVRNIKVGLGLHPQLVADREHEIDLFLRLVKDAELIGEIGLDFSSPYIGSKSQQISCFKRIVRACADYKGKVLSIHSVKATNIIIDELNAVGAFQTCKCIFHWFTGTAMERKRAIENGAYFSVNPKMLKTKSGQETIRSVPANKLLLETDASFTFAIESVADLKATLRKLLKNISVIREEKLSVVVKENMMRIW